ncbi:hypothetical protein WJX74_003452 [Apatococcus lobatus]|uniref:Uncharacterized protein n=1 Tax=Apatococcus lobatus TaxID=904363 RepID=A0AAW1RCT8_9CHLO
MSYLTYKTGPDPHDPLGCSVPLSLWVLCMFVTTLGYWTTGFIQQEQDLAQTLERYVYDPKQGHYVPLKAGEHHVI